MKKGTRVMMTEEIKRALRENGSGEHVDEFGECTGEVIGPMDYGTSKGPEVDVRWHPSNLRYGYHPKHLKVVG